MKNKYPISDHYNGEKFYNPGVTTDKSLMKVIEWFFNRKDAKYPDSIENKFTPDFSHKLVGSQIAATFINHATFVIQTPNVNFVTDPLWAYRTSPVSFIGPARIRKPGAEIDQLPYIDFVLISHNHFDHMDIEALTKLQKKFKPVFITPLGNAAYLDDVTGAQVIELDWWQSYTFKKKSGHESKITLVPAQHWSGRSLSDRREALWGSFVVETNQSKIYFTGDSGYSEELFKKIGSTFSEIDLALLPLGAYEPRDFMKEQHMNPDESVKVHLDIHAKQSVGMHFGCFRLSDELWGQNELDLAAAKEKYKVEKFTTQEVGQTVVY